MPMECAIYRIIRPKRAVGFGGFEFTFYFCTDYKNDIITKMNEQVKDRLAGYGIRPSAQRMAVMGYLMEHCNHPTAETIYHALVGAMPTLSRTTVYNTLRLLVESGAALALDLPGGVTRYDGDVRFHAHFHCRQCGAVSDVAVPELPKSYHAGLPAVIVDEIRLVYRGTCEQCMKHIRFTNSIKQER